MLNQGLGHAQYLTAVTISTQQVNIWSSEPTSVLLFFSAQLFLIKSSVPQNLQLKRGEIQSTVPRNGEDNIIVQGWTQAESLCLEGSTGLDTRATGASIYKKY